MRGLRREFPSYEACVPCKETAPILADLPATDEAHLVVEFIDIGENPSMAKQYNVRSMPTQILYDGHAMAGTSMGAVEKYLHWIDHSRAITWVKRVCGVLVICRSGYLIYATI